jgi:hypothetical protein
VSAARWPRRAAQALVAGLALGAGARLVMRFIGLASPGQEGFSWGGTLEVMALGMLIGAPLAFFFLMMRRHLEWRRPLGGLVMGTVLFGASALQPPSSAREAMAGTDDPTLATALLFAALWIGFGLLLELLHGPLPTPAPLVSNDDF